MLKKSLKSEQNFHLVFKPMLKFVSLKRQVMSYLKVCLRVEEGFRNDISLKVIQPKAMKADKGREGGHKIGKMGRRRLWMTPYDKDVPGIRQRIPNFAFTNFHGIFQAIKNQRSLLVVVVFG